LTYFLRQPDFTIPQVYVMFLLFFAVGLWITEAIPPFAVGIMIIGFLVFSLGSPEIVDKHDIDVKAFVDTWSDSVIWLMLGGFFLSAGLKITGLDFDLFKLTASRFSKSQPMLLFGLMITTALMSMVISNTATTAMMFAAVLPLLSNDEASSDLRKAIALGIPAAAGIGGMGTIIGSPPNAVAADLINNSLKRTEIGFLEWMYFSVPVVIVLLILVWKALLIKYPLKKTPVDVTSFSTGKEEEDLDAVDQRTNAMQKRIMLSILGLTVLLWLTGRIHNIPIAAVSGIPIIGLTMLSVVTSQDVRELPWDTLMLVAGGLSLGLAIQETGLSKEFVAGLKGFHMQPLVMVAVFAYVTVILSNIMSNTATVAILVPAASLISGADPVILPLVVGLSASCALFLPVSTPPNAIAFSTGYVEQKDFRFAGLIVGLGGPILIMLWVYLLR
jgi:sodium-dependent dicarboxylate transporter 2/3/5